MEPELTEMERKLLIRCGTAMESKDPEHKARWEHFIDIFQRGYEKYYGDYLPNLTSIDLDTPISDDVYTCVDKILEVYSAINQYKQENPGDTAVANDHMSTFPGFFGNDYGEYHGFLLFLGRSDPSPEVLAGIDPAKLNSHHPMVSTYNAMISYWESLGNERYKLSKVQITKLLSFWTVRL